MADFDFDRFDGRACARGISSHHGAATGHASRFVVRAGALTSIALVLGVGYWGYQLAVRNMHGIPVIQASDGPMRTAPDDPGGQIADHQGLSVNTIAAEGGVSAPADRLTLAPAPITLSDGDLTGTAIAMVAPVSARSASTPGLVIGATPQEDEDGFDPLLTVSLDANTDVASLANLLSQGAVPLTGELDITLRASPEPVVSMPKGTMIQSPRPRARSEVRPSAAFDGQTVLAAADPTPEITGDALASGTRLVQLGAFDSEDIARKEWDRLSGKFADLLIGKTRIVQAAQSGGRTFYRLRAMGFADESESRRFCSALVAERAACIPVAVR
ncbi:SPOR domain-containing protein [Pseudorhodobacter ferrugineus]|uniref:SPOR domain-containing protein n=1 Tax=Pseudorhodobacter ferrugineus TaxID=77008 RepID=UPI0003B5E813|nr:SPOR domain-containing protein [Pseudorhodobacter ferrugineus]